MQILPRQILSDAALISDAAAVTAFRSHSPDLSKPPSNWIFISFLPRHILLIFPIFAKGRHSDPPNELRRAFVSAGMTSESCDLISPMYARFTRNRKKKYTHAKVSRWGKAAAHSTGALGISSLSFFFLFFFFMSTECIMRFSTSPSACHPTWLILTSCFAPEKRRWIHMLLGARELPFSRSCLFLF